MRNRAMCCNKTRCKRFRRPHHECGHKKNCGNVGKDETHLLFELFKHFLRTRLEEQGQTGERSQGEPEQPEQQCQETGEVGETQEENSGPAEGTHLRCGRFGPFKRGKHQWFWGKHHHGHPKKMNQQGFHHHGVHHHHHSFGRHHKC